MMNRISNQFKRDIKASLITLILYLPLLFWWQQSSLGVSTPISPTPLVLNIQNFHCKEEVIEEAVEEEPILEEPMIEEEFFEDLQEIMKEPIVPEPIPQPLSTKTKPIVEAKKIIKKKIKKRKPTVKKEMTKKRKSSKKSSNHRQKSSKGNRSKFLSKLKRVINSNKVYPRMAKKRGIQGSVKVSFTITSLGSVSNIKVDGSKAFIKATKKAIERSFPVDIKGVSLPITLNLTLNYRLKRTI